MSKAYCRMGNTKIKYVFTDASIKGLRGILLQCVDDSKEFKEKRFEIIKKGYSVPDLESLALKLCINKF
eukprot:gene8914-862_t